MKQSLHIIASVLAFTCAALGQSMIGRPGAPASINQFAITDAVADQQGSIQAGFSNTSGYSTTSATISTNTLVLLVFGQSIAQNSLPTPFTPVNPTAHFLSVYDGLTYVAKDPLLGPTGTGGNYTTKLADKLITDAKFARVIVINTNMGGSSAFDWTPGGVYNQRVRVACLYVRKNGWIGNANAKFGVIYDQGQQDATLGTSSATWQAQYATIKATLVGLGCDFDWFVPTDTMVSNATNATIQGAQAAVVSGKTFAGANTDSLTGGTNRQGDGTHLSDVGGTNNVNLWATNLEAHY